MKSNRRLVRVGVLGYTQRSLISAEELPPLRDTKRCCQCKQILPLAEFMRGDKMMWACVECVRAHVRKKRKEAGQKATDRFRSWYLRAKYGITSEQYEQLSQKQNHLCAICGKPELAMFKSYGRARPKELAVDHDHDTGTIRGLLCAACNTAIGSLAHDAELVRKAAAYLERTTTEPALIPRFDAVRPKKKGQARRISLKAHLTIDELEQRYRSALNPHVRNRWQALCLLAQGYTGTQIGDMLGYSSAYASQVAKHYNQWGPAGVELRAFAKRGAQRGAAVDTEHSGAAQSA